MSYTNFNPNSRDHSHCHRCGEQREVAEVLLLIAERANNSAYTNWVYKRDWACTVCRLSLNYGLLPPEASLTFTMPADVDYQHGFEAAPYKAKTFDAVYLHDKQHGDRRHGGPDLPFGSR